MNISLTPELERLVGEKVKNGMYHSASEVIRDALRLLIERDRLRDQQVEALRRGIQVGLDQLDRGEQVSGPEAIADLRGRLKGRRDQKKDE